MKRFVLTLLVTLHSTLFLMLYLRLAYCWLTGQPYLPVDRTYAYVCCVAAVTSGLIVATLQHQLERWK